MNADGSAAGTYMHGMFERAEPRYALIRALGRTRGFEWSPAPRMEHDPYDELARVLAETVSLHTTHVSRLTLT